MRLELLRNRFGNIVEAIGMQRWRVVVRGNHKMELGRLSSGIVGEIMRMGVLLGLRARVRELEAEKALVTFVRNHLVIQKQHSSGDSRRVI